MDATERRAEVARVRKIIGKPSATPLMATCGQCGRKWDDNKGTSLTPTPSGRCPFEYAHKYDEPKRQVVRNRLTQDAPTLFRNQYGDAIVASSLRELLEKNKTRYGTSGHVGKQYVDKKPGGVVWNGYVIGRYWYTAFKWAEVSE